MSRKVKVKEPPRVGQPNRSRYHLLDGLELIGWTDDHAEAQDWLVGFGPVTNARIEDRRAWTPTA